MVYTHMYAIFPFLSLLQCSDTYNCVHIVSHIVPACFYICSMCFLYVPIFVLDLQRQRDQCTSHTPRNKIHQVLRRGHRAPADEMMFDPSSPRSPTPNSCIPSGVESPAMFAAALPPPSPKDVAVLYDHRAYDFALRDAAARFEETRRLAAELAALQQTFSQMQLAHEAELAQAAERGEVAGVRQHQQRRA